MSHIHITENGRVLATISLDHNGVAQGDGPAANHAIHEINHGHKPEDGQALLDAIVERLDRSTMIGAHHCHEEHVPKDKDSGNVDPAETDHWPEHGDMPPDEHSHKDVQFSNDLWG